MKIKPWKERYCKKCGALNFTNIKFLPDRICEVNGVKTVWGE